MSIKQVEVKKVVSAKEREEALQRKALSDSLDAEKHKKDAQLKTVAELEKHIIELRKHIDDLIADHNVKKQVLNGLNASIAGANSEFAFIQSRFEKENAKLVKEYNDKLAQLNKSDATMQAIIAENRNKEKALSNDRASFDQERNVLRNKLTEMERALAQNKAEWAVREKDILDREEALKQASLEFEAYKESLTPEIARITAIKNENASLVESISSMKINVENMRLAAIQSQERAKEQEIANSTNLKKERERIANEEARLRTWEQNLKDLDLEVKVKEEEAQKMMKRYQLTEKKDK